MPVYPSSPHERQAWEGLLKQLDPFLAGFAEAYGLSLARDRWDMPSRQMSWHDAEQKLHKNINVYIQSSQNGYVIVREINAWRDSQFEPGKRARRWRFQKGEVLLITDSASPQCDVPQVSRDIQGDFDEVSRWAYPDHDQATSWSTAELPPRALP